VDKSLLDTDIFSERLGQILAYVLPRFKLLIPGVFQIPALQKSLAGKSQSGR